LRVSALCHAGMVLTLAVMPLFFPLGALYWSAVAAIAALLLYEHWLVRPEDLSKLNVAFFHVNVVVGIGLLVCTVLDLLICAGG